MPANTWHFLDFLTALDRGSQAMLFANMGLMVQVGLRWFGYLAAMMIVACGIASAWRHYDWGMTADRFRSLAVGIAITYSLLQFYNTPIPSTGLTFPETINETALDFSKAITTQLAENLMSTLELTDASLETPSLTDVNGLFDYGFLTGILLLAEAAAFGIIVFGHVGQGVALLVGPLFIPWMMIPKLSKIFWGWLTVFLTFAIYPIVAAAVLTMIGNAFTQQFNFAGNQGTLMQVLSLPVVFVICVALIYAIFKIPAMSHGLMSGVGHSDFGEFVAGFVLRAFL